MNQSDQSDSALFTCAAWGGFPSAMAVVLFASWESVPLDSGKDQMLFPPVHFTLPLKMEVKANIHPAGYTPPSGCIE